MITRPQVNRMVGTGLGIGAVREVRNGRSVDPSIGLQYKQLHVIHF